MEQVELFRPVGQKELDLIKASGMQAFPPRLSWQPIFYPVLNFEYAAQIAGDWNTNDEFSGYVGYVLSFEISKEYFSQFNVENVGSQHHNELWVPAEQLEEFNQNIVSKIEVRKAFYGASYKGIKEYETL